MKKQKQIKILLGFFIVSLIISGATAMPVETELRLLLNSLRYGTRLYSFVERIYNGVVDANARYPFLFYGFDWLAFAHFVLAILFIGPYRNPVKNKWIIEFGMIACVLIIPFALVAGGIRGIPLYWRFIDCSFGIIGILPLYYCYRKIRQLEQNQSTYKINL
jgi:hypothetical protein